MRTRSKYKSILDTINSDQSAYNQARVLKLLWAGKEVLLKSVAQPMPTYSMSVFLLLKTFCENLG